MADGRGAGLAGRATRSTATLACALAVFYGLPLRVEHLSDVARLVALIGGLAGLVWLVGRQIRHFTAEPADAGTRLLGVLTVLYAVIVFFALSYYLIQRNMTGQFDGLSTRTDALYYTVVTLGTVGYGDVHAVGQVARVVTMVQITFDLVVIGVLAAVVSAQVTERVKLAQWRGPGREGDRGSPSMPRSRRRR